MLKIVIIGAGGHAQVVADILMCQNRACGDVMPMGYVDDNPQLSGCSLLGLPVLGSAHKLSEIEHDRVIVAIGDNARRQEIFDRLTDQGEQFATCIHPTAIIASSVKIGVGTMICAGAIVNPEATIGNNVILNTGSTVDHHNQIANHVHIAPGVHLGGTVTVQEGAFVGIGSKVIPQRKIGAWSTVGAGAAIVTDVEPKALYIGVPGRKYKDL